MSRIQPAAASTEAANPVRLRSETFLPAGDLKGNLDYARALVSGGGRVHVLARFEGGGSEAARDRLAALGVVWLGYVPDRAHLLGVPDGVEAAQLADAGVTWLGALYPEDKVPPRLISDGPGAWAERPGGRVALGVRVFADAAVAGVIGEIGAAGGVVVDPAGVGPRGIEVEMPVDRWLELTRIEGVRWVEDVAPPRGPLNDGARLNGGLVPLSEPAYGLDGSGIVIGEWDEGKVDVAHRDFGGRARNRVTNGVVALHSTHVAGTLTGSGENSAAKGGTARQWRGVAPGATLVAYSFDDPIADMAGAIGGEGVAVSHNSWGYILSRLARTCDLAGEYGHEAPDYDRVVRGEFGRPLTVVFAAGNNRSGLVTNNCGYGPYGTISPPGTAKNVITVGAIFSDDSSMTYFSSWGPVADGRLKPDLVAAGDQRGGDQGTTSLIPGNSYGVLRGTSMSSPVVSGAVALLIQDYRARFNGQDPLPSTVKGLLVHTAEDLAGGVVGLQEGPDFASGYGRLRAQAAVDQMRAAGFLVGQVADGATNRYRMVVPAGWGPLKLTLVWDDPAAAEHAAVTLVNDLDLAVWSPSGARAYPWTLDPLHPAAPAVRTGEDHLNVVEQVSVLGDEVEPGEWEVEVVGGNVAAGGSQKYTLVFPPELMSPAPLVFMESATFAEALPAANGNGSVDPGEWIEETVVFRHTDGLGLSNVVARLTTSTPGVVVERAESAYPDILSGTVRTNAVPFVYRIDKTMAAGAPIEFTLVLESDRFAFTNRWSHPVGAYVVTNILTNRFNSGGGPWPIPDEGSVVVPLGVVTPGRVASVSAGFRIQHPWQGDVGIELLHPGGSSVLLVQPSGIDGADFGTGRCGSDVQLTWVADAGGVPVSSGSAPFLGVYRPTEPLAKFTGLAAEGLWGLRASDIARLDTGTVECWELELVIEELGYVASVFNRAPVASARSVPVIHDYTVDLTLGATDPDGDALTYQVIEPPVHGVIVSFDAGSGALRYQPDAGYSGADRFSYEVSDGYASATGSVEFLVSEPSADVGVSGVMEPGVLLMGEEGRVRVWVTNRGPNEASGVVMGLRLGSGLVLRGGEVGAGVYGEVNGVVEWEVGRVGVGGVVEGWFGVRGEGLGMVTNGVGVRAVEGDVEVGNNAGEVVGEVKLGTDLGVGAVTSGGPGLLGQGMEWVIGVTNAGPNIGHGVVVRDHVGEGFVVVSASGEVGEVAVKEGEEAGWVEWRVGDLEVGGRAELRIHVRGMVVGELRNEVWVSGEEIELAGGDNYALVRVEVVPAVDMRVGQGVRPGYGLLGREVVYEVGLTNGGPSRASGVGVSGAWPGGVEVLGWELVTNGVSGAEGEGEGMTSEGGEWRWEAGVMEVGEERAVRWRLGCTGVGMQTNRVTVSSVEAELSAGDNGGDLEWEVRSAVEVGLGGWVEPDPVLLGGEVRYGVWVTNAGPGVAHGVVVRGAVGSGLSLVRSEVGRGEVREGGLEWEVGELGIGEGAVWVLVERGEELGMRTNAFWVGSVEEDVETGNNAVELRGWVRQEADIGVRLGTVAEEVLVGGEVRYEIGVTNAGPETASGVVVEDEMPAGTQLVRVEGVPMEQTSVLGRTVTVNLGQLSAGTETPLALVVAMFDAGHATNTVRVRAVEAVLDAHAEDNQAQGVTVVKPFADLRLVQSALPSPALLDDKVTISVTVSNLSTYRVPDAALVDLLPMSADLLSLTATQGDVFQAPGLAQFDLGSLEPGAVAVVELELRPRAAGALTNEVQITSRYAQPGDANLDSRFVLGVVETPTLGVARSQNKMVISWPRAAEHFVLEYADKPWRPDAWLPERNARVLVDDRVTVTVKTGNDGRYYRLRRPDAPTVSE